jgi:hypothetical protein
VRIKILVDGVYNDEHNTAIERKAGDIHDTLTNYGMSLVVSGLAEPVIVTKPEPELPDDDIEDDTACDDDDVPVTIDLRDGVSDVEAHIAGKALKRRRKTK